MLQPLTTRRQHSDNRKSLKKTCDANNFGMAAKILILIKVLRNNPTFHIFLLKNIGGYYDDPPPPPRGQKIVKFFSPNIRSNKKNSFCLLWHILFMNGFSATVLEVGLVGFLVIIDDGTCFYLYFIMK